MCGRAALTASPEALRETFGLEETPVLTPHYNIPPSQPIPVVRVLRRPSALRPAPPSESATGPGPRRLELLRWGLVPAWAKDLSLGNKLTLARVETVATTPAFRDAIRRRRCLVVVDGFYEWKRATPERGRKSPPSQPYFVSRSDRAPFALAGVWDRWVSRDGELIESCAIVTRPSKPPVDDVHDRMPLVLDRTSWDRWLDPRVTTVETLTPLFEFQPSDLVALPVSTHVNDPRHDDPECLAPPPPPAEPPQRSLF
jgi:putative SOS response-associated peptidase YedK